MSADDGISRRALIGAGTALMLVPAAALARPSRLVIECPSGRFTSTRHVESGSDAWAFKGIRYGLAERFSASFPVPRVIMDADEFGPVAPQRGLGQPQSEDCLYLNIWTTGAEAGKRPVMVYFHGGAYSNGSVTDPQNDGATLAATEDVVVVTVNHRLNAFGYLYLARFDPRFADSGNAGQLDLILALHWIKANIAAFGGDPGRVFVFGQSGGGAKIATLMGMPAAKGLFHSAATMSGQQVTASGPLNATKRAQAYLAKLGVKEDNLQPLLDMPMEKLIEATEATDPILGGSVYFGPVLDMKWLVRHPFWPDANPQSNAITMILGNTHDETRAFISPDSDKVKGLTWDNIAGRMAPELRMDILPEWVVAEYRAHFPDDAPERIFYRATTAGRSWPGQVLEADARAAAGARATWVYQVDFQSPVKPDRGAPHTMDIALAFGTLGAEGSFTGTGPEAQRLSRQVMGAFAALARTGKPAAKGLPGWAPYTLPNRATMVFDKTSRVVNDPRKWERELFARVPYIQPGS
ncbi:carboxylesterase/lipase family protein [Sphingomonas sp. JC676]|uniref:carboxylesterase/lipase family protein n=1 Tax=Sphingomonas sp. JC676 TaxID=2768065 RepID=UPI0016577AEA|nr:carboxylesterase family protein [Sphingomonas sp. JC676]MBC9031026.1 carboxylesterase/lipase family protein [Sphingomonas sp. JC676]